MAAAKITELAPVLPVSSNTMRPMLDFFTERLGFSADTLLGEPTQFAMLRRDGKTVMLTCARTFSLPKKEWAIYFWVDDVDALHAEAEKRGARPGPLVDKEYGNREFEVTAPDGRIITFGQ